jgi:predicted Fe-Mo cluster-binding NifX family protein
MENCEPMEQNIEDLIVAVATVDGAQMPSSHFGQAPQYEIYRVSRVGATRLQSVANPHPRETHDDAPHQHHHGRGEEGRGAGIGRLLGGHGVQVMVSRAFGQNILRMRERFVPVKVDTADVDAAIGLLQSHWDAVVSCWSEGNDRKHLVLRSK